MLATVGQGTSREARMQAEWFKDRLRELRTGAGLSRQELADRAGLKPNAIRDLEQGVNQPSWSTVIALCQALGVTCDAFLQEPAQPAEKPKGGRPRKRKPGEEGDTTPGTGE